MRPALSYVAMQSPSLRPFPLRRATAAFAALLVSVSALALPRPSGKATLCPMSGAPDCCCAKGEAPVGSAAECCRLSTPGEAAPSLQSATAPVLAAPAVRTRDLPDLPAFPALSGRTHPVAPRARSAPLFLLFAALLV